jgi:hypothetical protein
VTLEQNAHGHPWAIQSYSIERSLCESCCSAFFVVARSALGLGSAPSTVETARRCQSLRRGEHLPFCRGPGCGRFAGKRCLREQATAFPALTQGPQADESCEATAFPALSQTDKSEAGLLTFLDIRTGIPFKNAGGSRAAGTHRTETHTTGNPSTVYCNTVPVPSAVLSPVCVSRLPAPPVSMSLDRYR